MDARCLRAFSYPLWPLGPRSDEWLGSWSKLSIGIPQSFHCCQTSTYSVSRAHPTAGWFAACKPDMPCITPGTYAFLGAAAALGLVFNFSVENVRCWYIDRTSGVMRITVTVVVIMFELTGALTYILPTMVRDRLRLSRKFPNWHSHQIVLLVTKSVGDFFGISGIADETIRFNGYPFLDKEDHAFHISGK